MKHTLVLLVGLALTVGMLGTGCKDQAETPETAKVEYKCPGCDKVMEKDAYCAGCNAVASTGKMIHCETCDKDMKEGTYCAKCNRFMFDEKIKCKKSDKMILKGEFCSKKNGYKFLPTVAYNPETKKPCACKDGDGPACK